uniref:Uncharacterized protein n=1 Tax=Octopus bimaculoides TaxID=37653 RepID=A0A0L8FU31_OCTBM
MIWTNNCYKIVIITDQKRENSRNHKSKLFNQAKRRLITEQASLYWHRNALIVMILRRWGGG